MNRAQKAILLHTLGVQVNLNPKVQGMPSVELAPDGTTYNVLMSCLEKDMWALAGEKGFGGVEF